MDMNPTELRIGNYIFTDRMESNELIRVNTMSKHPDKDMFLIANNYYPHLTLCQCKPILLTEEWLVKLGFDENGTIWIGLDITAEILQVTKNGSVLIYDSNKDFINLKSIFYVHQLQNLYFALTGEELCETE